MSLDGSLIATYKVSDSRHLAETPLPRAPLLLGSTEQPERPENWQLSLSMEKLCGSQGRLVARCGTWAPEPNRSPATWLNPAATAAPCTSIGRLPKRSSPAQRRRQPERSQRGLLLLAGFSSCCCRSLGVRAGLGCATVGCSENRGKSPFFPSVQSIS